MLLRSVGAAHLRALELCDRVGQRPEFLGINLGLSVFQFFRSDLCGCLKTAERLLRWGQLRGDIRGCILGELVAGRATAQYGALATARSHLKRAVELLESSRDDPAVIWTYRVAWSRAVTMHAIYSSLSRVLCWMGYPDQALTRGSAAVEQREEEVRVVVEPLHLWHHLWVLSVLGEARDLVTPAEKMGELCRRHNLTLFAAVATIMRGCAIARCGDPKSGRAIIGDGLAGYIATGAVSWSCYFRALLAETYQMTGETDQALRILLEALEDTERTGERWYVAELHGHIGEAHRQRGAETAAQQSFDQALAVARGQGAKLWEL